MAKNIITATDVRNNFFNLLDLVINTGNPVYIRRGREVKVKLEPVGDELEKEWEKTKKILDASRGIWGSRTEKEIRARFKKAELKTMRKIRARDW